MDGGQRQKRRADFELNEDFISSMPSEIIDNILVRLPIKEAVRTSVLSRKWKSSWASIPNLVFINKFAPESELIRSVDMVLMVHQGPILEFSLDSVHSCKEAIDRWLLVLSQSGLKDLSLSFDFHKRCKLPSSLLSCDKLENLYISCCSIYAPQCFQGLKLLRNLDLFEVEFVGITIEEFVSGCPLLETLKLFYFVAHGCLVIRAPNLKWLNLLGEFSDLSLETPKLIYASISRTFMPRGYWDFRPGNVGCKSKILHTIGALPNIVELNIGSTFCEYLASGPIPEKLPLTLHHLKKIDIDLNGRRKDIDTALCIFKSAPNVKTLRLWLPSQNIWEDQRIRTISFLKVLEVVEIRGFEDLVSLLAFAKFILSSAPLLQKLVMVEEEIYELLDDGMEFLMKLANLPRLSSKAVILFE